MSVAASAWSPGGPADPRDLARAIVQDARACGGLLLLADYDGVLDHGPPGRGDGATGRGYVGFADDGLPLLVRGALVALAAGPATRVAIVSRHDAGDLEARVNVPGVIYVGCHGLEIRGGGMAFCHPDALRAKTSVPILARALAERLAAVPGVDVAVKDLGVTARVRRSGPSLAAAVRGHAEAVVKACAADFRVWPSADGVDVLPDVDWPSGAWATWIIDQCPLEGRGQPAVVYIGDDDGDEDAYLALRGRGHAVNAGPLAGASAASAWVADRAAAVDLLAQIAFAWSVRWSTR